MRIDNVEKSLKRFLKKKVSYTLSLLVAFMISGEISMAEDIISKQLEGTREQILSKIRAEKIKIKNKIKLNEKKIKEYDVDMLELLREGNYYSKMPITTNQLFFSYQHNGTTKGKNVTKEAFKETIEATEKEYKNQGLEKVVIGNGVVVSDETFRETIELGTQITPLSPKLVALNPKVTAKATAPQITNLGKGIGNISFNPVTVSGISGVALPSISSVSGVTPPNITITPPQIKKITQAPNITIPSFTDNIVGVTAPTVTSGYTPRTIPALEKPAQPQITLPPTFTPPALPFVGTGFYQGWYIGSHQNGVKKGSHLDNSVIIENYERYDTPNNTETNPFDILVGSGTSRLSGATITAGASWTGTINASSSRELDSSGSPLVYSEKLVTGSRTNPNQLSAFINELRDHDAEIGGHYRMEYVGGDNATVPTTNYTKIFLSHNPAGRNTDEGYPVLDGSGMTGWLGQSDKRTAKFTGTLELHGSNLTTPHNVGGKDLYEILVGVEHQLWDSQDNLNGYSIFENRGKIKIASGNNVIGIMIDEESWNNNGINKHHNNQTKNLGTIEIGGTAQNSIGIDFGDYKDTTHIPVDVELGDIIVGGSNNYGFRMKNIKGHIPTYYDDVTISGGTGKTVLVQGTQNVGLAIGRSLSPTPNPHTESDNLNYGVLNGANPISNFFGVNVKIDGTKGIGFLRLADSSTDNTNDYILNNQTMGVFDIGDHANQSVLVRADKYGIVIDKNITTTGTGGTENVVGFANGEGQHVYNKATIHTGAGLTKTTGLVATATTASSIYNIANEGTIQIEGQDSTGMYVGTNAKGKNTGTITLGNISSTTSPSTTQGNTGVANLGTFDMEGTVNIEGQKSSGLYNENIFNIVGDTTINLTSNATGIYNKNGTFGIQSGKKLNITGTGLGIYASGGTVNLNSANNGDINIDINGGTAGVAVESGAQINLQKSKLSYSGDGLALYSDGVGKIDISNSEIILGGNAVGLEIDASLPSTSPKPIDLSNTTVTMNSNDAIVAKLKNVPVYNISNLETSIRGAIGTINDQAGTVGGVTYDQYKLAALDGGGVNFDVDTVKYDTNPSSAGYFYSRRILGQALQLTVKNGKTVTASTNTNYATQYFNNQVVGLDVTASKNVTGVGDTAIKLEQNATVVANRTDTSSGAPGTIGLYSNYGTITLDSGTHLNVEKENDTINDNGVGIFAVNGSEVLSNGSIDVAGNSGVGIYAQGYRVESGVVQANEFGKTGEGNISIDNKGDILLEGLGSIGIYADNNSGLQSKVISSGDITVGNELSTSSSSLPSIGIYGNKTEITNSGDITVGTKGVGIYGVNSSQIKGLGNIVLDTGSIGVKIDDTTIIDNGLVLNLTSKNPTSSKDIVGLYYDGTTAKTVDVDINSGTVKNSTLIYTKNSDLTSKGDLTVGEGSLGIYANGKASSLTAINDSGANIKLIGDKSAGMYTTSTGANIKLENKGDISLTKTNQVGMYADGNGAEAINTGKITLDGASDSLGIYVANGGVTKIDTNNNIVFTNGAKKDVGIFVDKSSVNIDDNINFADDNTNQNIYLYGKDSTITSTAGKKLTVNGNNVTGTNNEKTIGIYLEDDTTGSNFTGEIEVNGGALGIYSKGNNIGNTVSSVKVKADGADTVGIYAEKNLKLDGTIDILNDATGVYGTGGIIDTTGNLVLNMGAGTNNKGMYLIDGAYTKGGDITINNSSSSTNVAIMYGGASGTSVTTDSNLKIMNSKTVGLYINDGINLVTTGDISTQTGENENVGIYVENGDITSKGTITLKDDKGVGIYTKLGKGNNDGIINLQGSYSTPQKQVGLLASSVSGTTAEVENRGTINVGENIGIYIGGQTSGVSKGKNLKNINVTTGTGVYVEGANGEFDSTSGDISVTNPKGIGVYLKDTVAGKIKLGNMNLAKDTVGVYGDNAQIDFDVNSSASSGEIGVVAENGTVVSGDITVGQGSKGLLIKDNSVIANNIKVETGVNSSDRSFGIIYDSNVTNSTLSGVKVNAKDGIGVYLSGTNMSLTYDGNVETNGGMGIYVPQGTTLTNNNVNYKIDGNSTNKGIGVYIDEGTAQIGVAGAVNFNFVTPDAIGIYNKKGNLTLGNNFTVTGQGTLAVTDNGSMASSANLTAGLNATALLGQYSYDTSISTAQILENKGSISAVNGGTGMGGILIGTTPLNYQVTLKNSGTISSSGNGTTPSGVIPSIAIYSDTADIENVGSIDVGTDGVGIYYNGATTGYGATITNNNLKLTGNNGIGVYIKGKIGTINNNVITDSGTGNTGVVLEGLTLTSPLSIGSVTLGDEGVGVSTKSTTGNIVGNIVVGDSTSSKRAIGVVADGGSNVDLTGSIINAGKEGIGIFATAGGKVTVPDLSKVTVGTDGIYLYVDSSSTGNIGGSFVADNQIGMIVKGNLNQVGATNIIAKNGGIGAYIDGTNNANLAGANITVLNGQAPTTTTAEKYSMGVYYSNVNGITNTPNVSQNGNYTIGYVVDNSSGNFGGVNLSTSMDNNRVGIMAQNNSNVTVNGNITISGDKNIGVYGNKSNINLNGDIQVANSAPSNDRSLSSIGVYLNDGNYNGIGDITVGDYSLGVYGENLQSGEVLAHNANHINIGDSAVGLFGEGATGGKITANVNSGINVGNNGAIGIYAKNIDAEVNGDIKIGKGVSVGIVSEGNGSVDYTGGMSVDNKGSVDGSIAIYKVDGNGTIKTSSNNWNIGDGGYGIYLKQNNPTTSATIDNNADMDLGTSAVGIYSSGANVVKNNGDIQVGDTDVAGNHNLVANHKNSVGIYVAEGTSLENNGKIVVDKDHSVGIYGTDSGTTIINKGNIFADKGGIGVLVRKNATAINDVSGNIKLGTNLASCGVETIGMAAYDGATIKNKGYIEVGNGVGMFVGTGANLVNEGTIKVDNGVGIQGPGNVINTGNMIVAPGARGELLGVPTAQLGAVQIQANGTITINNRYTAIGGTLTTKGAIIVNGAYVDVTTGVPMFNASNVSGEVNILPNFASTGNGISYKIEDFVPTAMTTVGGSKLTPVTSPLFVAKVTNSGDLVIAKRPYEDITLGKQYDNLDKGLDNILRDGNGKTEDAKVLMEMNEYLSGLTGTKFQEETERKIAETRGDIYSTIQDRMQDIDKAFDNSFDELVNSYNATKNVNKYSVIFADGKYENSTVGIDNYKYKTTGLLYMNEKEKGKYGNKYGYSVGFAGSKFDFEDGGSKENVYSLRAGVHKVTNLSTQNKVSLLSRLELGYNRHEAERKINLANNYEAKGNYNTYTVSLDNKLSKVLYTDFSKQLEVYTNLNMEYGKIGEFSEKSGKLKLKVKDNDYHSIEPGVGVNGYKKFYLGKQTSLKFSGDIKYAYELGENYDGNKAKLKDGNEDYYDLVTPKKKKGRAVGKIGVTLEKSNHMGVTFEVKAQDCENNDKPSVDYGVRLNYKF